MPSKAQYMYIWEYIVSPEQISAFEHTYGCDGEWVRLFRRSPGYVRTELHRDRSNPQRYITIDYWESQSAWQAWKDRFAEDFAALDKQCENWTTREVELGRFEPVQQAAS